MNRILSIALALALLSMPALAADDVWSPDRVPRAGKRVWITPTTVATTQTVDVSECRAVVIIAYSSTIQFWPQFCDGPYAKGVAGTCQNATTSVIDASSKYGIQIDPAGANMRLNVTANAGDTIELACKGG